MKYLKVVKDILDSAIPTYCSAQGITLAEADVQIAKHIKKTQSEHFASDPAIDYDEPLCRLAYLFSHAGANAYLFEQSIINGSALCAMIASRAGVSLNVCTVGGGPGTEVLGLVKYLGNTAISPSSVRFTVLDRVQEWHDSWLPLANIAEEWLQSASGHAIPIAPSFYTMDVTTKKSYEKLAFLFAKFHVVVLNYLLSENKVRMGTFPDALAAMVAKAASGCVYVFIDRNEKGSSFRQEVKDAVVASGLAVADEFTIGGCMDDGGHAESDLGAYAGDTGRFKRRPRRWFRHSKTHKDEVFVIVGRKP